MATKKTPKKKEVFDYKSIKLPEDGFKRLGMNLAVLPDLSKLPVRFSFLTTVFILAVIIEAVNDGWKADYSNQDQKKYFPWCCRFLLAVSIFRVRSTATPIRVRLSVFPLFWEIRKRRNMFLTCSRSSGNIGF